MKKIALIFGIVILVVAAVVAVAYSQGYLGGERAMYRMVSDSPELKIILDKALAKETEIVQNPEEPGLYMDAAFAWKSLAELSPEENRMPFFKRSLALYQKGAEKFGQKNILFYYNTAQVASEMGKYELAEQNYKTAISISPADPSPYVALAQLYEYNLKKPVAEVVAVLNSGAKEMSNPAPIIWARASYLRRMNQYAEALKDYEVLVLNFPENAGYKEIVAELKAKIEAEANK